MVRRWLGLGGLGGLGQLGQLGLAVAKPTERYVCDLGRRVKKARVEKPVQRQVALCKMRTTYFAGFRLRSAASKCVCLNGFRLSRGFRTPAWSS